jgi:uncharacterized membrane protein YkvA (DUF1232 family)
MIGGLFRMIRAIIGRRYGRIPWKSLGLAAILLVYLFSPVDIIPDYIPFLGVIDDVVLLGFFLRSLQKETKLFMEWEKTQGGKN